MAANTGDAVIPNLTIIIRSISYADSLKKVKANEIIEGLAPYGVVVQYRKIKNGSLAVEFPPLTPPNKLLRIKTFLGRRVTTFLPWSKKFNRNGVSSPYQHRKMILAANPPDKVPPCPPRVAPSSSSSSSKGTTEPKIDQPSTSLPGLGLFQSTPQAASNPNPAFQFSGNAAPSSQNKNVLPRWVPPNSKQNMESAPVIQSVPEPETVSDAAPGKKQRKIVETVKCEICNWDFRSDLWLQRHLISKPHLKRVELEDILRTCQRQAEAGFAPYEDPSLCILCDARMNPLEMQNHFRSIYHQNHIGRCLKIKKWLPFDLEKANQYIERCEQEKQESIAKESENSDNSSSYLRNDGSNINLNSVTNFEQFQMKHPPNESPVQLSNRQYYCAVCNIQYDDHFHYNGHMRSKAHNKRVQLEGIIKPFQEQAPVHVKEAAPPVPAEDNSTERGLKRPISAVEEEDYYKSSGYAALYGADSTERGFKRPISAVHEGVYKPSGYAALYGADSTERGLRRPISAVQEDRIYDEVSKEDRYRVDYTEDSYKEDYGGGFYQEEHQMEQYPAQYAQRQSGFSQHSEYFQRR